MVQALTNDKLFFEGQKYAHTKRYNAIHIVIRKVKQTYQLPQRVIREGLTII